MPAAAMVYPLPLVCSRAVHCFTRIVFLPISLAVVVLAPLCEIEIGLKEMAPRVDGRGQEMGHHGVGHECESPSLLLLLCSSW